MSKAKAVAKQSESNVIEVLQDKPAYLQDLEAKGPVKSDDNFDSSDVVIPRIKLLQGLSAELETFDNAKKGLFWHTGMDIPLGPEFDFVPVSRRKKYLLIAPLEDGQGVLARAEDAIHWQPSKGSWQVKIRGRKDPVTWTVAETVAKSGLAEWGTYNPDDENSPPAATLFYDYLVLLPDFIELGPVVISLARSAIRRTRKGLNDKIRLHESAGRPMQSLVFRAKSIDDTNSDNQEFKNWMFTSNGFASEALFKQAIAMKDALADYKVLDEEGAAVDENAGNTVASDDF